MIECKRLKGERFEIAEGAEWYPEAFSRLKKPPRKLYVIGNPYALSEGLAVVGARSATPYGISCAERFAKIAAQSGLCIISGGARGCDSASHRAALSCNAKTVAFLGGGCDEIYPKENASLFQQIIDSDGAVVSENAWSEAPKPYHFRERNRLIASLAKATLIVEAGLPSGTFSTADEALSAGREVLVVPGSISSKRSYGANRLIYQGATPVIDDETFKDQLRQIFNLHLMGDSCPEKGGRDGATTPKKIEDILYEAICAQPCTSEFLLNVMEDIPYASKDMPCASKDMTWLLRWLSEMQRSQKISRYPDGRYGPVIS